MHLMQYLNEKGERVYTMKVSVLVCSQDSVRAVRAVILCSVVSVYRRRWTQAASRLCRPTQVGDRTSSST